MEYSKKPLNTVKRIPKRGNYNKDEIFDILDSNFIGYMGYVYKGYSITIPMAYGRNGNEIYIHGSSKNRMINSIQECEKVSMTVTEIKALVLAKSVFHHSMNYRSAVIFGKASLVESENEKIDVLKIITENILKGRWKEARLPNKKELKATAVLKIQIESASAKIREGEPIDEKEDLNSGIWSGLLTINSDFGKVISDSNSNGLKIPDSLEKFLLRNEY
ncbi:pyridoxamine 5'-phosphate oxidase family protein [Hyphobacterium sp. CCMP332]|nr:pyridoxamine 5'-phosphate oxidase family protein [Hyphobacterium sp. CCMP332]